MPKRNKGPHLNWRAERQVWEIRWFEQGRKRSKSTRTDDRKQAEKALADFLVRTGPAGPCDPSQRVIADTLSAYGEERGPLVADPERIAYAIDALVPYWGERVVSNVREGTCRAYCHFRNVSPGTTRRELTTLRAAINHDYRQGRLTSIVSVWLPPRPEPKDRWLPRKEAGALLRAAKQRQRGRLHLPLFILIGLYTGARKETILSLRWPQVDFERGLIDFNPPGRKRTSKGRPIIPIPRRLMTFLRLARKRGHETGYVIQYNSRPVKDVKKAFARACRDAGFDNVTPHTLRHTAASWMVQKGVSFAKVARYLGHSDSRTTERIYAHHAPDYLEDARRAFD